MRGRSLFLLLKVAFGLAILSVVAATVGATELAEAVSTIKPWPFLLASMATALCILLRVWRWHMVSRVHGLRLSFGSLLTLTLQGIAISNLLPTGAGDVAKSYLGYRRHGLKEEMLGSVWADKLIALSTLGLTGAAASVALGMPGVGGAGLALFFMSSLALLRPGIVPWRPVSKVARCVGASLSPDRLLAFAGIPARRLVEPFTLSIASWLASAIQLYLLCLAFSVPASLVFLLAIAPVMGLAELFPFTAAGLGSREAAAVYLFSLEGLPAAGALLMSLTGFLLAVPIPGLVGVALLKRRSGSFAREVPGSSFSTEAPEGSCPEAVRALVLTLNFPRFPGDIYGCFHLANLREQLKKGLIPTVLAPLVDPAPVSENVEGIEVLRFPWRQPRVFTPLEYFRWKDYIRLPSLLLSGLIHGRRLLARRPIDLIVSENVIPLGLVAVILGALCRKPVVLATHGSDVRDFYRLPIARSVIRFALKRARMTISVSEELATRLETLGIDPVKIRVVPNGIDISRFRSDPWNAQVKGFRVGHLGALKAFRNPLALLEAAEKIVEDVPELSLTLGGDGPLAREIQEFIEKRGLGGICGMAGEIAWDRVPEFLGSLDVVVFASTIDNACIALMEAMACEKAVVAVDSGWTSRLIRDGKTGLLVSGPDQIAAALLRLHQDPFLRRKLGRAGRRLVERECSLSLRAERVQSLYKETVEMHSRPPRRQPRLSSVSRPETAREEGGATVRKTAAYGRD